LFVRELPEEDEEAVRFVSGLATLPGWARQVDGVIAEACAFVTFVLLLLWIFWLW
jgi:hypothetical protein